MYDGPAPCAAILWIPFSLELSWDNLLQAHMFKMKKLTEKAFSRGIGTRLHEMENGHSSTVDLKIC